MQSASRAYFRMVPRFVWVLALIMVVGLFLRTYQFTDWLVFSPDQARDATLIRDAIHGKSAVPITGPQVGFTKLDLGPLYYEFQYASAKVFGMSPQAMAYPDLLFSLLAIPVFFFFLRRYVPIGWALVPTGLFSISFFIVTNSRFAWNPNPIPFFSLLFLVGVLMLSDARERRPWWVAPTMVGIGAGAGIQLHALLLVMLPIVSLIVLIWLAHQKVLRWRDVAVTLCFTLLLNTGQVVHEFGTGGANVRHLLEQADSGGGESVLRRIRLMAFCQIEANAHIVSGATIVSPVTGMVVESCSDMYDVAHIRLADAFLNGKFFEEIWSVVAFFLAMIFSLGGYWLWYREWQREGDISRRRFLALLALYQVVAWVVFAPVISSMGIRYFIILFFVPFVLLWFWCRYLLEFFPKYGKMVIVALAVCLVCSNTIVLWRAGARLAQGEGSDVDTSILGDDRRMAAYILETADPHQKTIRIDGRKVYLKRFLKPLDFVVQESGRRLTIFHIGDEPLPSGTQSVYIVDAASVGNVSGGSFLGQRVEATRTFGGIMILILRQP